MKISWWLMAVLYLLLSSVVSARADEGGMNKLGYGFEPGRAVGKDFVERQIIIGIKEGARAEAEAVAEAVRGVKGKVLKRIEGALLIELPAEGAVRAATSILSVLPEVRFIERNGIIRVPPKPRKPHSQSDQDSPEGEAAPLSVSSDPNPGNQWYLTVIRKTALLSGLSDTPPTVAVLDTGVDYTHPDLQGKVILGKNCIDDNNDPADYDGHGTHVAGIVAAMSAKGSYGGGVYPNCKILAVKVLDPDGNGSDFDIACGMQYVRQVATTTTPPARIVNMSLGLSGRNSLIAQEVAAIKAAGLILVAPAGNDNSTASTYPGADPNTALRVMATEDHDCRASFSNFSPSRYPNRYNIAAPGWNILSTLPGGKYGIMDGTSMATPVVAGVAALVWGQEPTLTRNQLVSRLVSSGKATSCGFAAATSRVDVRKAIEGSNETALVGQIIDPFSGLPVKQYANARLYSGSSQMAADSLNGAGMYEMANLDAGTGLTLRGERTGYVSGTIRNSISIAADTVQGPFTDALPKARPSGDITIVLDWKRTQPDTPTTGCTGACNGWEFDLMMKMPSGESIDPFDNKGSLSAPPYVRNPRDSYDDLESAETIVIRGIAENGVHKVFVDKWVAPGQEGGNPSWTGSEASVQLFNGSLPFGRFYASPPADCGAQEYWYVGKLTKRGTTYTWTNVNTCSNKRP
ncbi:MAG: S8 family serine peptidase [Nitrospirales bacterium]|nr:S8 family serine peptidase [Nitrospirales bacterium]